MNHHEILQRYLWNAEDASQQLCDVLMFYLELQHEDNIFVEGKHSRLINIETIGFFSHFGLFMTFVNNKKKNIQDIGSLIL